MLHFGAQRQGGGWAAPPPPHNPPPPPLKRNPAPRGSSSTCEQRDDCPNLPRNTLASGTLLRGGGGGSYEPPFHYPLGGGGWLFRQAITGADGLHGTDTGTKTQKKKKQMEFLESACRGGSEKCHLPPFPKTNCKIFLPTNGQNQGP